MILSVLSAWGWAVPGLSGGSPPLAGELVVFHAGSLAVPFKQISAAFEKEHPKIRVHCEAAGSRRCARKIADLHRRCDVMASADYQVIDNLLIPEYADWNIKFAGNEMIIAWRNPSRRKDRITAKNWFSILARPKVRFGRSDPNADPCGYRTVLTVKLAETFYQKPGLAERLLKKNLRYIRPKETDLLALLETGEIDYLFIYRSVATQHGLNFITLPDEINLGKASQASTYRKASVRITGKKPGTWIVRRGEPMIYGVTIPKTARNPRAALAFVRFLLDKNAGLTIMAQNGQPPLVPAPTKTFNKLPPSLKERALPCRVHD